MRVEFGDATTAADPAGAHVISQAFPHTYGQPLAHFLRATTKVPDAQIITEHPAIRYRLLMFLFLYIKGLFSLISTKSTQSEVGGCQMLSSTSKLNFSNMHHL